MIDSKPAGTNQPASGAPAAVAATTRLGHVHLWTKSIPASTRFYRDVLGFQEGPVSTRYRIGEVGLGADQPHVIAFNTWHGEGARAPPADAHGLRYVTVVLPDVAELDRALERVRRAGLPTEQTAEGILVRDPSRLAVVLTAAPSGGYPASRPPDCPVRGLSDTEAVLSVDRRRGRRA